MAGQNFFLYASICSYPLTKIFKFNKVTTQYFFFFKYEKMKPKF
jgi:hypothetical protein